MAEIFVISDTHFGHKNILNFTNSQGGKLRPFKSLTEMHVIMIDRWNAVVGPKDKVYHLGDVAFNKEGLKIMSLLNGKKRLVKGNHDLFKGALYAEYFDEVYGVRQINGAWMTHVPMHTQSVYTDRVKVNIHGHLHDNKVTRPIDHNIPARFWVTDDPKYFNACVECIDYTPVSIDTILASL